MLKKVLYATVLVTVCAGFRSASTLNAVSHNTLKVPEPSDVALSADEKHIYIASDKGVLWECGSNGEKIRRASFQGMDFEGVEVLDGKVYVVDETTRQVHRFDGETLQRESSWYVPYSGGRNKSYETIAYNHTTQHFILITEKQPILIKELNKDFTEIKQHNFSAARDISSAKWHNGFMYLLSDEDRTIYECNPENYEVIRKWRVNVLNPEGIAFDKEDNLIIVADDMATLYHFNPLSFKTKEKHTGKNKR